MKILICNVGSTSLKYKLFAMEEGERVLARGGYERIGTPGGFPSHREAIQDMLRALAEDGSLMDLKSLSCVGFKVVLAKGVTGVQLLTEEVLQAMEAYASVAPAHNPPYIAAIRQFRALLPETPLVGSFETGFHKDLPPEAYLYPIPLELSRKYGIRRYGFHGASHEYLTDWVSGQMGRRDLRIVSCHLGGSGSLAAVKNGVSIDTSLGMSLQCGVMHNNRIGDMDPYIIFYLVEECGYTLAEVKTLLQKKSGLLGLSGGISGDVRDLETAAAEGNQDAETALSTYAYGIRKYIGAYAAALGGLDAIVFGGGIGEHSALIRGLALQGLEFMGVEPDEEKNRAAKSGDDISRDGSRVRIFVRETNEELVVARKAKALLER